jgi:hypothetical protein
MSGGQEREPATSIRGLFEEVNDNNPPDKREPDGS